MFMFICKPFDPSKSVYMYLILYKYEIGGTSVLMLKAYLRIARYMQIFYYV